MFQKIIYGLIKTKDICPLGNTIKKIKRQDTDLEKYLQCTHLTKDLYLEYREGSRNAVIRRQSNFFKCATHTF